MTVPTTLVEELEQAARLVDCHCDMGNTGCIGLKGEHCSDHLMAMCLRARAERVRELGEGNSCNSPLCTRGDHIVYGRLTGPLPSPPGTGSGGR